MLARYVYRDRVLHRSTFQPAQPHIQLQPHGRIGTHTHMHTDVACYYNRSNLANVCTRILCTQSEASVYDNWSWSAKGLVPIRLGLLHRYANTELIRRARTQPPEVEHVLQRNCIYKNIPKCVDEKLYTVKYNARYTFLSGVTRETPRSRFGTYVNYSSHKNTQILW